MLQRHLRYWSFLEFGVKCYWKWVLFTLPYYPPTLFPSPPRVRNKNKREGKKRKATTTWIYNVRVSLLFRLKFHFYFNALLCVKLPSFLSLHLRLSELSINRHILRVIFKVLGLERTESDGYTEILLMLKYMYFLK